MAKKYYGTAIRKTGGGRILDVELEESLEAATGLATSYRSYNDFFEMVVVELKVIG